jgi:hypothetical protein
VITNLISTGASHFGHLAQSFSGSRLLYGRLPCADLRQRAVIVSS